MTIVTDNEVERVAKIVDPVWMNPPEGPHVLENYPGQADKYRNKARNLARAALSASDRDVLVAEIERLREELTRAQCRHEEWEWLGTSIAANNNSINHVRMRCKRCFIVKTDDIHPTLGRLTK